MVEISVPKCYRIDWDKVETLEDLKNIVRALDMQIWDNHPKFEGLKQYLVPNT